MPFEQPNPRYVSRANLNVRDGEHYDVASRFTGPFSTAEFVDRYRELYPARSRDSMLPSDYCFNKENKGNANYPRFLMSHGRSRYSFVGLDGSAAPATPAGRRPSPRQVVAPGAGGRRRRSPTSPRRFIPSAPVSLVLNGDLARAAIRAYNADLAVTGQEHMTFANLGRGFIRGQVERHLRLLDREYSTRSHAADLAVIGQAIEHDWGTWSAALASLADLRLGTPGRESVRTLLGLFLSQPTQRMPRSLATKALHFAAPQALCAVDTFAADLLGKELAAGRWADTATLDADGMSMWYLDYLAVIHDIGKANPDLLAELFELDRATSPPLVAQDRMRGLPKIIDKIVWWIGRESKKSGGDNRLFES